MLEKRPSSENRFGNCSFSVIIDKERRPVKNMRKKVFTFSEGKWNVRDFTKIENKKADYLLIVKDNQKNLRSDIAAVSDDDFPPSAHQYK